MDSNTSLIVSGAKNKNLITRHLSYYIVILIYLIIKTTIFDYEKAKLLPDSLQERLEMKLPADVEILKSLNLQLEELQEQLSLENKQNITTSKEISQKLSYRCENLNPLKFVAITSAIHNKPDCWLWRLIVAYNSGFIIFAISTHLDSNDSKIKWKKYSLYSIQACFYILTYCLDMPDPMRNIQVLVEEQPKFFFMWWLHIIAAMILGLVVAFVMIRAGDWHLIFPGLFLAVSTVLLYFSCNDGYLLVFCWDLQTNTRSHS